MKAPGTYVKGVEILFIWGNISTGGGCNYNYNKDSYIHKKNTYIPFTGEFVILR